MFYITGDTHADFSRFKENKFPIQSEMTKIIILFLIAVLQAYKHC